MELFRALGVLCEPPGPEHERIGAALELPGRAEAGAYADLFLFQLYPYASVYLGPNEPLTLRELVADGSKLLAVHLGPHRDDGTPHRRPGDPRSRGHASVAPVTGPSGARGGRKQ